MGKSKKAVHAPAAGNKGKEALATLQSLSKANKAKWAKLNAGKIVVLALMIFGTNYLIGLFGMLKLSALYAFANDGIISGRQDNSVKMRNGVERRFVVPRLVRNAATGLARGVFSLFSSAWAGLTNSERASWNNVDNVFRSNRVGRQITIKGKQLFIQRNVNLVDVGASTINDYVPSEGVAASILTDGSAALTAGALTTLEIVFAPTPTDGVVSHKVFATAPLPTGVSRPKSSAYRLITVMPPASASPFDILTAYTTKYGAAATVGQRIGIRLEPVNENTGQLSGVSEFLIEVA